MADTSKAQKLASAKKRFKELKDQKKNASTVKNAENPETNTRTTPVDSMTSSTHSSITTEHVAQENPPSNAQIVNYFSASPVQNVYEQPAAFFDNFSQPSAESNNYFNVPSYASENFFDQIPQNNINTEYVADNFTVEQPEIIQNDLYQSHENEGHQNLISNQDSQNLMSYLQAGTTVDENKQEVTLHSNVESLKQLSDQMAELVDTNCEYAVNTSITDLEKRNLELAALYEQEKIRGNQLNTALIDSENRNRDLEVRLQQKDLSMDLQISQELGRLKEELQSRIQTMGMLVAENTELSANLSQFEITTKQKTIECEELQARLKTSRSLVADLEREINNLKLEKSKNDNMGKEHVNTFEKLNLELRNAKEVNEEMHQDLLEAKEKLKHATEENITLQQQFQDVSSKLHMANIKIQQLTTGESHQVDGQVEQLTSAKFALEKEVANLNQTLKTLTKERDESSQQYQQYAEQLNGQLYNLSTRIEQLQQDNENLVLQEQNRIKHIGDLERQLQNLQNDHVNFATPKSSNDANFKNEYETTKELLVQTQIDKTNLEENVTKVTNENEMLLRELNAKNESLSQLESMVEQLRGNQPDSVKLLATMESDKVAAARAVAQNKELKSQMDGMNEVFVKLNDDKVELTEKLTVEQKSNKELFDKLQKTEITLQTLADAIEIKDRELCKLRDSSTNLNKQVLQQEQLTDRLRHYEAHDHSAHALQSELQEARNTITRLTNELNQGKQGTLQENGDTMESLRTRLRQLEVKNKELECGNTDSINNNDELDKEVAMKYLQDKFTRTMQDIAELQDEKQRLEHLVDQLQTETETIGEYVALYQHQRMVLKQRALEKDQQLKQLASDREQMKEKLHKLNSLIHKVVNNDVAVTTSGDYVIEQKQEEISEGKSQETAKEIINLLSEIETSNLVQPNSEEFHHCPWCQGNLITV
ncbi:unnamed protein product [Brassicogethes aeneus]|uniref:Golgin subfamily A conserved domain-containing protein n=1 Tax=Brassicogethes aeneus TaxID=1431903 RepID=A0A9P0FK89_BRAAE|nr:unnamed protein product [Brassicogethes aeneus]